MGNEITITGFETFLTAPAYLSISPFEELFPVEKILTENILVAASAIFENTILHPRSQFPCSAYID